MMLKILKPFSRIFTIIFCFCFAPGSDSNEAPQLTDADSSARNRSFEAEQATSCPQKAELFRQLVSRLAATVRQSEAKGAASSLAH